MDAGMETDCLQTAVPLSGPGGSRSDGSGTDVRGLSKGHVAELRE